MDHTSKAILAVGALMLALPVWAFDELGAWGFLTPVSNLDWDEAGRGPDAQYAPSQAQVAQVGGGSGGDDSGNEPQQTTGGGSGEGSTTSDGGSGGGGGGSGSDTQSQGSGAGSSTGDGGSGGGGSSSDGGSGGSGVLLGSGGWSASGSGPMGSQGSGPAFTWPTFAFGSMSFFVALGGGFAIWSGQCMAFCAAMWSFMAAWAFFLCMFVYALLAYVLAAYLGLIGGLSAAAIGLILVYMHQQGILFAPAAAPPPPPPPPAK